MLTLHGIFITKRRQRLSVNFSRRDLTLMRNISTQPPIISYLSLVCFNGRGWDGLHVLRLWRQDILYAISTVQRNI
jgi:hypothetical protein